LAAFVINRLIARCLYWRPTVLALPVNLVAGLFGMNVVASRWIK
jgi:hypothetical protein